MVLRPECEDLITDIPERNSVSGEDFEHSFHDKIPPQPVYDKHVFAIGLNGTVFGIITTFIGAFHIFGFPMICSNSGTIHFSLDNYYGFSLWCGIMLTISSVTGVRTTVTKRQSTVHRYLGCQLLTTIIYVSGGIIVIYALAHGATDFTSHCLTTGTVLSAVFIGLGLCIQLATLCFSCFTIFRGKALQFLQYCVESLIQKCCPQIGDDFRRQVDVQGEDSPTINW